jgi:tetratricopeptide (TPR) repeat protein
MTPAARPAEMRRAHERVVRCCRAGDYEQALALLEGIEPGDRPGSWRRLAQVQFLAGRRVEAQMTLREAFRKVGPCAVLHLQEGLFLSAEGRTAEARDAFARAVEADRGRAESHYYLGLAEAALHRPDRALEPLRRAVAMRPERRDWAWSLVVVLRALAGTPSSKTENWSTEANSPRAAA